jgi:hypothetical protein
MLDEPRERRRRKRMSHNNDDKVQPEWKRSFPVIESPLSRDELLQAYLKIQSVLAKVKETRRKNEDHCSA